MSTLNKRATTKSQNLAGGTGYLRTDKQMELISIVLNYLNDKDQYYMSNTDINMNLKELLREVHPEFIAKLMVFTRNTIGLRMVSKSLADHLMKTANGSKYLTNALIQSFVRPDDMTDLLALTDCKKSNAFRRACKYSLERKFNSYQFKKYEAKRNKVKLRDIVKLVHPSGKVHNRKYDEGEDIFKKVIESRLDNIVTAQTVNAAGDGYNLESVKALGYMALIKNLVNIFKSLNLNRLTQEEIGEICKYISDSIVDENRIIKSKILPFRFIDAYETLKATSLPMDKFYEREILNKLIKAMVHSGKNLNLKGRTALLLDESGSMSGDPIKYGKSLVATMMNDNTIVYQWASDCRLIDETDPVSYINNFNFGGGGTYIEQPLKELIRTKTKVDNVIVLTDMQLYSEYSHNGKMDKYMSEYWKDINADTNFVFWNLNRYGGATPINMLQSKVYEVCSSSNFIVTILGRVLEDKDYLVKLVDSIDLSVKSYQLNL